MANQPPQPPQTPKPPKLPQEPRTPIAPALSKPSQQHNSEDAYDAPRSNIAPLAPKMPFAPKSHKPLKEGKPGQSGQNSQPSIQPRQSKTEQEPKENKGPKERREPQAIQLFKEPRPLQSHKSPKHYQTPQGPPPLISAAYLSSNGNGTENWRVTVRPDDSLDAPSSGSFFVINVNNTVEATETIIVDYATTSAGTESVDFVLTTGRHFQAIAVTRKAGYIDSAPRLFNGTTPDPFYGLSIDNQTAISPPSYPVLVGSFLASGGIGPYTYMITGQSPNADSGHPIFSIDGGSLLIADPNEVSVDEVISVSIYAYDSVGGSISQSFDITITA